MILESPSNLDRHLGVCQALDRAIRFIRGADLSSLPDGRTEIDADRVFALCRSYVTRAADECRWEAHRRFGDVQIVISGCERIGWSPLDHLRTTTPYDAERDVEFFELAMSEAPPRRSPRANINADAGARQIMMPQWLMMSTGLAAVFFPHDAHQPETIFLKKPEPVRKVVIKFAIDP